MSSSCLGSLVFGNSSNTCVDVTAKQSVLDVVCRKYAMISVQCLTLLASARCPADLAV